MKMDIQRLRNLTTGKMHTEIGHVYQDIEFFTGAEGLMTHMIPNAFRSLLPFLKKKITDPRFWDDAWDKDKTHIGEIEVEPLSKEELVEFWADYEARPSPFEGKPVVTVVTP